MAPATCVPVKELKNTAEFTQTVQNAKGPVYVTKNGREIFVTMSIDIYQILAEAEARQTLYNEIAKAEEDFKNGRFIDGRELLEELKGQHVA